MGAGLGGETDDESEEEETEHDALIEAEGGQAAPGHRVWDSHARYCGHTYSAARSTIQVRPAGRPSAPPPPGARSGSSGDPLSL